MNHAAASAGTPHLARPIRAAVTGLSPIGLAHAAVLGVTPEVELTGLHDARRQARSDARDVGFDAPLYPTLERLLEKAQPEALVVAGPQQGRAAAVRLALEAGVAVLVERPMARTLGEAEAMVALAQRQGVPLAVAHALPWHPVFARSLELVREGAVGPLRRGSASTSLSRVFGPHRLDPRQVAGGVLAHLGADVLFTLVTALGPAQSARATAERLYGAVEDELRGTLTFPGGAEVSLEVSWSTPGFPRMATVLELDGEHGRLLASDDALELDRPGGGQAFVLRLAELPQPSRFDLEGEATWLGDAAFLAWVSGGPAPLTRAAAALDAHRAMDALYRSASAGGQPVAIAATETAAR